MQETLIGNRRSGASQAAACTPNPQDQHLCVSWHGNKSRELLPLQRHSGAELLSLSSVKLFWKENPINTWLCWVTAGKFGTRKMKTKLCLLKASFLGALLLPLSTSTTGCWPAPARRGSSCDKRILLRLFERPPWSQRVNVGGRVSLSRKGEAKLFLFCQK